MKSSTDQRKKPVDWQKIELDYRAGIKTMRQIANENGISHALIGKRVARDGWTRDLSARISAKTEEILIQNEVNKKVNSRFFVHQEKEIVEVNGQMQAQLIFEHRELLKKVAGISHEIIELAGDSGLEPEKRTRIFKSCVDSLDTMIRLQRQAFGIDPKMSIQQGRSEDTGLEQLLRHKEIYFTKPHSG